VAPGERRATSRVDVSGQVVHVRDVRILGVSGCPRWWRPWSRTSR